MGSGAVFLVTPIDLFGAEHCMQGVHLHMLILVILLPLVDGDETPHQVVMHSIWPAYGRSLDFQHDRLLISIPRLARAKRRFLRYWLTNLSVAYDKTYSDTHPIGDGKYYRKREQALEAAQAKQKKETDPAAEDYFDELTRQIRVYWPKFAFKPVTKDDVSAVFLEYEAQAERERARANRREGIPQARDASESLSD